MIFSYSGSSFKSKNIIRIHSFYSENYVVVEIVCMDAKDPMVLFILVLHGL